VCVPGAVKVHHAFHVAVMDTHIGEVGVQQFPSMQRLDRHSPEEGRGFDGSIEIAQPAEKRAGQLVLKAGKKRVDRRAERRKPFQLIVLPRSGASTRSMPPPISSLPFSSNEHSQ
jgi:hypothetical protein